MKNEHINMASIYWKQITDFFSRYDIECEYNKYGVSYEGYYNWFYLRNDLVSIDDVKKAKRIILNNLNH
jgi:hypothetical protein